MFCQVTSTDLQPLSSRDLRECLNPEPYAVAHPTGPSSPSGPAAAQGGDAAEGSRKAVLVGGAAGGSGGDGSGDGADTATLAGDGAAQKDGSQQAGEVSYCCRAGTTLTLVAIIKQ